MGTHNCSDRIPVRMEVHTHLAWPDFWVGCQTVLHSSSRLASDRANYCPCSCCSKVETDIERVYESIGCRSLLCCTLMLRYVDDDIYDCWYAFRMRKKSEEEE